MAKKEVDRPFLTIQELQILSAKEFSMGGVAHVRDLFMFCCYTGLAYADSSKLKRSEMARGIVGEMCNEALRHPYREKLRQRIDK